MCPATVRSAGGILIALAVQVHTVHEPCMFMFMFIYVFLIKYINVQLHVPYIDCIWSCKCAYICTRTYVGNYHFHVYVQIRDCIDLCGLYPYPCSCRCFFPVFGQVPYTYFPCHVHVNVHIHAQFHINVHVHVRVCLSSCSCSCSWSCSMNRNMTMDTAMVTDATYMFMYE
jgi:hypothetical protein